MRITFRQVDAFRTVVSTGSVTEAAKMLGVSQPAVSRLISDFEQEVGFPLFNRVGRFLEPTEEARLLVAEVRQAVSGMEHIKEAAAAIRGFGHARLAIVTTPTLLTLLVPDLLGRFAERRPDTMVKIEISPADDVVEWMVSQHYDFGIRGSETQNPAFDGLRIEDDDLYCIVPKGHPLAVRDRISAGDLEGESYISYFGTSRLRFEIDAHFDACGVRRRMLYEARTTDAICRLVAAGLGVSVVGAPRRCVDAVADCVAVPFDAPLKSPAIMVWSNRRPMSRVAQEFLQIARTHAGHA